MPNKTTMYNDLTVTPPERNDVVKEWNGYKMLFWFSEADLTGLFADGRQPTRTDLDAYVSNRVYDADYWPYWTAKNWQIPLVAVALYVIHIPVTRWAVEKYGKWNVKNVAFYWNSLLSVFSWCGMFLSVPPLVTAFYTNGLYFTTCAPAQWYGRGLCGFAVACFIYSKVAELFDTSLLLLSKRPVIALQWWHHSTVLLYCWHSFSAQIATGIWFAAMNYSVHSVMYGYFAVAATSYRKYVAPYAIFITLAQLVQMLVGMFVTAKAVMYQMADEECHVNRTNSFLGMLMYASYFVLFGVLFMENYVWGTKKTGSAGAERAMKQELPAKNTSAVDSVKAISKETSTPHVMATPGELAKTEKASDVAGHPTLLLSRISMHKTDRKKTE